jgi:hypothetical protein
MRCFQRSRGNVLSGAVAGAVARTHVKRAEFFSLVVGFAWRLGNPWEIGRYFACIRNSPEPATAGTAR